jgi:hypothetical protein
VIETGPDPYAALAASAGAEAELARVRALEAEGRHPEALQLLRQGAATGSVAARTELAKRVFVDPALPAEEGLTAIVTAANDGGGEAAHIVSVLSGAGLGVKHNWNTALVYLQRAAELGHEPAQRQLEILASRAVTESGTARWRALREAVDLPAWLNVPRPRVHSIAPRIGLIERFIPPQVCDWLIERARPNLVPATTYDRETGAHISENTRTNSVAYFRVPEFDMLLVLIRARMAAAAGLPLGGFEATVVLHYSPGQVFEPHFDFLETESPGYAQNVAEQGQRVLTFLTYLNDDYDAGETDFPAIGWRYKGRKGDALFFWNVDPSGQPDKRTYHAGLPTTRGEKWLLSQWVRAPVRMPPPR